MTELTARRLPPGVSGTGMDHAVADFRAAVGDAWVLTEESDLAGYRDPFAVLDPSRLAPSAVVVPASVEEVRDVVRAANTHRVPLSPISAGRNLGYGGPAPRLPGAVTVDLKRLNRIVEIDDALGYAVVEPGVTFFDLHAALRERQVPFVVDVPDLGWGSVLANTLERGVGYTAYGDHYAVSCGLEVVLPDGDLVRTGMGALPGGSTAHVYRYGYGPLVDGIFTQSNLGIVTRMGVWLLPEPPAQQAYLVTLPRAEDLGAFVDVMRPLRLSGQVTNVPTLRSVLLDAAAVGPRSRWWDGAGPVPDHVARDVADELGIGMWNCYGTLVGSPESLPAQESALRAAFAAIPGARFHRAGEHDSPVLAARARIMSGIPDLETRRIFDWVPHGGHVDFAPVAPARSGEAMAQYEFVRRMCTDRGQDYMGIFIVGRRELHHITLMMFDTADQAERDRVRTLCSELVAAGAERGWGVYRAHPAFMDQVADTFSFNDHALRRLGERLKDALDPNGILAPGKSGIWPAGLRERRP
jgi:4-cresol dehydrogenase (hydroxylating) flavoprotein subunit